MGGVVDIRPEPTSVQPSLDDPLGGKSSMMKDAIIGPRSDESLVFRRPSLSRVVRPRDNAPFELGTPDCHDPNYPEYKNHPDVKAANVDEGSKRFCEHSLTRATLTAVDDVKTHPLHAWRWRYKDVASTFLDFKVHWRVNCRTTLGFQDIEYPLGPYGPSCVEIMIENYRKCNNGGIGGSTQAGCLVYTFNGGRKDQYY
ncbi:uncharacterized protein GLRG_04085 [Colletotrichum graminicola M1.001]|uniref:Uncharacterized protein n=1 Tax=Colletotrichum graminicola (strain M1.001 / M2 / FGSC 10212) TaxID=645133 RepID=E3QDG9_COLGM|nr:uncharacterized protein GLRG_04085 [Colletotrichum graminicola M1.001]EFQ28941.1 hypothetical protein GLRG_04085 [Colletotrichum graminicola M1.001]